MSLHLIYLAKILKNLKISFCLTPLWISSTAHHVKVNLTEEKTAKKPTNYSFFIGCHPKKDFNWARYFKGFSQNSQQQVDRAG